MGIVYSEDENFLKNFVNATVISFAAVLWYGHATGSLPHKCENAEKIHAGNLRV